MEIIIYLARGILNVIYFFMKLAPVKDKVTIVSRQSNTETDDIRMLREEIEGISPNTQVVCLCRKTVGGLSSKVRYAFHVLNQMKHISRSRAVVIDSYCIGVSFLHQRPGLKVVQMWHALGALKKFGKSITGNGGEGRNPRLAKAMNMHGHYTKILISGEPCRKPYMEAFGYPSDAMFVGSLPRVDLLKSEAYGRKMEDEVAEVYGQEFKGRKVVVYAPTFRKGIDISSEIKELAASLDNERYILVVKKHPLMKIDDIEDAIVDTRFSTMDMLFAADYVVCDYSAIVYEAALLSKPLFFYAFDLERYEGSRDFYLDYRKDMPGIIGQTGEEVGRAIMEEQYDLDKIKAFADYYVEIQRDCTLRLAEMVLAE